MPKIFYLLPLVTCWTLASAQVYQSVDEQGNPVYSDQPSPGGEVIEVPEPNLGDAVAVPPPPPEPEIEARPEIEADREPSAVDGEMIGVERKKTKSRRPKPAHLPAKRRGG